MPHRTAGCGKSSLRPLMAGSSPSLPDGSNPSAAIVQSASDVQCSRLLKTTGQARMGAAQPGAGVTYSAASSSRRHSMIAARSSGSSLASFACQRAFFRLMRSRSRKLLPR